MTAIIRVLCIALLATTAYAEEPAKTTDTPTKETAKKQKLTPEELQIMAHYHDVDVLEIELGKVAQKNASSQAVKSYGAMLVKQHTGLDKQMKELAKSLGQSIPAYKPETDAEKQDMAQTKKDAAGLKKLKGTDFDREYLRMMVAGHDKELAGIDARLGEVQNQKLAALVIQTKIMLQRHADEARELQKTSPQARHEHKK
jgi:putative membrane protein